LNQEERILLYQATWSPESRVARRFLDGHGIHYDVVEVAAATAEERELQVATGSRRVPVLRIGNEWVPLTARDGRFRPEEAEGLLGVRPISGSESGEGRG